MVVKVIIPNALILRISEMRKPAIIAIEGYGGSGKTSLADTIKQRFKSVAVVPIDDFILKDRVFESWADAFDRKRLEDQILKPFSKGASIHYQKLLWDSNTLSDSIALPATDILIVEGISSYHPDIALLRHENLDGHTH